MKLNICIIFITPKKQQALEIAERFIRFYLKLTLYPFQSFTLIRVRDISQEEHSSYKINPRKACRYADRIPPSLPQLRDRIGKIAEINSLVSPRSMRRFTVYMIMITYHFYLLKFPKCRRHCHIVRVLINPLKFLLTNQFSVINCPYYLYGYLLLILNLSNSSAFSC